jgi:hypothetical protein
MKTNHFLLAAGIVLAMAFTFSCSSGDDPDDNSSGGGFDESSPSQVLYEDGSKFKASGILKGHYCEEKKGGCEYITFGSVTNGVVKLQLPPTIEDKYLNNVTNIYPYDDMSGYDDMRGEDVCTISQKDAKAFYIDEFILFDSYESLVIEHMDETNKVYQGIAFFYSSKSTKITCEYRLKYDNIEVKVSIDAKEGWNKIYIKNYYSNSIGMYVEESSTNNILTKEVGWLISAYGKGNDTPTELP